MAGLWNLHFKSWYFKDFLIRSIPSLSYMFPYPSWHDWKFKVLQSSFLLFLSVLTFVWAFEMAVIFTTKHEKLYNEPALKFSLSDQRPVSAQCFFSKFSRVLTHSNQSVLPHHSQNGLLMHFQKLWNLVKLLQETLWEISLNFSCLNFIDLITRKVDAFFSVFPFFKVQILVDMNAN